MKAKTQKKTESSTLVENKRAGLEYEFVDTYSAGVSLLGTEVKSLRERKGNLIGARVLIRGNEAFLVSAHIPAYQEKNVKESYDPERPRKLLITKKELLTLSNESEGKGLTLVPISLYNAGRHIKCSFALARKRKKYDKREVLKEKTTKRDIARALK